MSDERIIRWMDAHGVKTKYIDAVLHADSMISWEPLTWICVSGWTLARVKEWLNY